jgi:macrolide transport system ATP-binding/permease protein
MQPALILADEPTGNLDTRTSIEVMDAFRRLNDEGITLIMVTHELDIARYTKRNIIMRDGRIQTDRTGQCAASPHSTTGAIAGRTSIRGTRMRRILATFRIALMALLRNKMRTFLTMLGIIIGVGAVIAMISIGTGARAPTRATDRQPGPERDHRVLRELPPRRRGLRDGRRRDTRVERCPGHRR